MKSDKIKVYLDYESYNQGAQDRLKGEYHNYYPIGSVAFDEYERGLDDAESYCKDMDSDLSRSNRMLEIYSN